MKNYYKIIIIAVLLILLFVPFYPVTVVPEWELVFIDENGVAISSIRIDQIWKEYSLEFWSSGENSDRGLQSDSNGYIKLPAREIKVSVFQIVSSQIRDLIMKINPHASFGKSSYIVCRGTYNCIVSYKDNNEKPQRVIVK